MDSETVSVDFGDILIIDDVLENLQLLENIIVGCGYKARPVTSGAMGLVAALASPPDLILLDIIMPKMDGYAVCRQLKADKRTSDIPVIFVSSLDEIGDMVKGFECGGVDYITKPFKQEEVRARVNAHMQIRRLTRHLDEMVQERTEELDSAYQRIATLERTKVALVNAEVAKIASALAVMKDFIGQDNHLIPEDFKKAATEVTDIFKTVLEEINFDPESMESVFSKWLLEKLEEKDWSMRELARQSGFSIATVSRVIGAEQRPSRRFCNTLAHVLQIDHAEVLWRAGFDANKSSEA